MHENEFEKQVREKMDQLGFDPSENVWAAVNEEINQEKKRRRPFFWFFFFLGLLLAGGGYYFFTPGNNSAPMAKIKLKGETNKSKENRLSPETLSAVSESKSFHEIQQKNANSLIAKKQISQRAVVKKSKGNLKTTGHADIKKKAPEKQNQDNLEERSDDISISNYNKMPSIFVNGSSMVREMDSANEKNNLTVPENKRSKTDSLSEKSNATVQGEKKQKNKSSSWKMGFTAGAGISNVNQSLITHLSTSANYAVPPNGNTGGGDSLVNTGSPGFSFSVGAFVNRRLSERISIAGGLSYHYFSTRTPVGSKVNTTVQVYFPSNQLSAINSYYQTGSDHTYTNQYHFIEMPVSVNFQLNKSRQSPVFWEFGFSLAYLISGNALYYDRYSQVYVSSDQQINKMQWNGTTAVMFGFHLNKWEWQIGPQLQYAFSNLVNSQTNNSGHLLYGGIKIWCIPRKK